jgi:hypothetical protein
MSNLHEMKLHETIVAECDDLFTVVLRVPGGWMYRSYDKSHGILTSVFVPFDNEFQEKK